MSETMSLFPKVGGLHSLVVHDLLGRALGDLLARVQHGDPLREAHHRPHDVLDHDDRDAALVEREEDGQDGVHLGARQPGHAGEWPRDLKAPADAQPGPLMRGKRRDVLPAENQRPPVGPERARDAVDERGLARAVGADEPEALPLPHLQAHVGERPEAAEALRHAPNLQQGRHQRLLRWNSRRTRPTIPCGASMTKATRTIPTMRRFSSEEMVTVATCWAVPSRTAPMTGPTHVVVPPIIGIARLLTA